MFLKQHQMPICGQCLVRETERELRKEVVTVLTSSIGLMAMSGNQ
jgi:hypothetical protein